MSIVGETNKPGHKHRRGLVVNGVCVPACLMMPLRTTTILSASVIAST
jgi:hypothetical protein